MKMIEVSHLTKYYSKHLAVKDISFSVNKGDVLGFLGPNGAGKTTTMRMITAYMPASSGSVKISGIDVFEDPISAKKQIGYLPENPPLYLDMTVKDYLNFVFDLKRVSQTKKKSYVDFSMEKTDLTDVQNRLIGHLSKGYRQRIGLAGALVSKPKILVLDEPSSGLDPNQVIAVRELIENLKKDHTIILSTHILSEVQMICNRIAVIDQGKLVKETSLEDLKSSSNQFKVCVRLENLNEQMKNTLKELPFVKKVNVLKDLLEVHVEKEKKAINLIAQKLIEKQANLIEIRKESVDLERIFSNLTKKENL